MDAVNWFEVINALIFALVAVIVPFAVKYVKTRVSKEKWEIILNYAALAVSFAEQYYKLVDGETKYLHASRKLAEKAKSLGIELSDEEIRLLIESALKQAKVEYQDAWREKETVPDTE